jgi:hypothetical protein
MLIPVQAIPNQGLQVTLANQQVALAIYQTDYGLFMDVISNGSEVVTGVLCENQNRIVRDAYLGFVGDFEWTDTSGQGVDAIYTGLGAQFLLVYLETSDLQGS